MSSEIFPLLLITLLAVIVPFLANRMRPVLIPIVVMEILAGILIGKSGLNIVEPTSALNFIAELGFAFLMFLSGLEMNFWDLLGAPRENDPPPFLRHPVYLSAITFLLTILLAVTIGHELTRHGLARNATLMGLILSTTSLGVVVPVLKERGYTMTSYGQLVLMSALIGDFATLLLLSLTIALVSQGPSVQLLFFLILLGAFATAVHLGQRVRRIPLLSWTLEELSHATAQIEVRGAFALMVAWVFLAEVLGLEVILGAFLAGAFISLTAGRRKDMLREKLEVIGYGFLIPIFFINVGTTFDVGTLMRSRSALLLVPVLIVAAYLVKMLPALLFRFQFSWRESIAAGVLLSSRLSLIIAAAAITVELEMITPATNSALILVAMVTCTISPIIFSRIAPSLVGEDREGAIILGTDQLAIFLGERLRRTGEQVSFLGCDRRRLADLQKQGFRVVVGQPDDEEALDQAGARKASALIAIVDGPQINLEACRLGRKKFDIPNVIALADDPESVRTLEEIGVRVVRSAMATALALEGALHFPAAFEMLEDLSYGVQLADAYVFNRSLAGRPLRRVRLPGNVLVLGIRRSGEELVPNGDTALERGDILTLVGSPEALRDAKRFIQGL